MKKMSIKNETSFMTCATLALLHLCLLMGMMAVVSGCSDPREAESVECVEDSDCQINGACIQGRCDCAQGFADCDGEDDNGCEFEGVCECTVGETRTCYGGPDGTQGVGVCRSGTQVCNVGGWSSCTGQVTPTPEPCEANEIDEDCNGVLDNDTDEDGDGYSLCDGDCCDSVLQNCAEEV